MTGPLAAALASQAEACGALGSPLMERLFSLMARNWQPDGALAARLASWSGDMTSRGASVPLRLGGALHALVRAGRAPTLAAVYDHVGAVDDASFLAALTETFRREERVVLSFLDSAPQTNEPRRSVAIIAAAHWLARRWDMPFTLSELGASAGMNLIWDRYAVTTPVGRLGPEDALLTLGPDWRGSAPQSGPHPAIEGRSGVDLNPIDPVLGRERLMAYIWPDQPDRIDRTGRVLDALAASRPHIERGDAIDWLALRLATQMPGKAHFVYHTVAWQYFPESSQQRGEGLLAEAGRRATEAAPIARFAMEADGTGPGAAMTLDLWPGGERIALGRVDFHGRWIDWQATAAG